MDKGGNANRQELDVGNTSDVIVESQSTQLLDFVLGRNPEPLSSPRNNAPSRSDHLSSSADHSSCSKASDDSFPSASAPSYHFHGLATTQSQTQLIDGSNSQKENESAYAASEKSSVKRRREAGSRDTRSRTANCAQASTKRPLTPSRVTTETLSPPRRTKVATIPSQQQSLQKGPTKEPTKTAAMPYRRRPSPPVPSQDSFAGPPPSQDPDLYIATTRQFEIPLDELGRSQSQDQSLVSSRVEARTSINSLEHPAAQPAMVDYSLSSSSSRGKILVASSDTSDRSQDSQRSRGNYYSISQEPTQLNSDASVADASDHGVNEENREVEPREDVADLSTRVEPTQVRTQEETQIIEQSPSAVITSVAEPSAVEDRLSQLSLLPPEQVARHARPIGRKSEASHSVPAPGPSTCAGMSGASPADAAPFINPSKRSLLGQLPPEKLGRYVHHLQKNSVPVSDASRMATADTSLDVDSNTANAHLASSKTLVAPPLPVKEEEFIQVPERRVEMDISPIKPPKKTSRDRDQEVIPPSESDFADNSREEEEVEMGFEESPMKAPLISKGKQRADPRPASRPPRKPSNTSGFGNVSGQSSAGPVMGTSMLGSPVKLQEAKKAGGPEMGPPPVPRDRRSQLLSKLKGNIPNVADAPPVASTSAAVLHREQNPPSPTSAVIGDYPDLDSPEIPLARMVNCRMKEESESGNEEDMASDDEDAKPAIRRGPSSSRKRKRRNVPASTKKATKARASARKATTRATPASAPPSKKARTSAYVGKKFGAGMGTQVFALFKTDSCFYGAEVHSLNGNRAHVKFFDGLEDTNIGVAQMRRFDLRTGDNIIPGDEPHKAKVLDDSLWPSENEVNVVYIEGPDEGLELPVTADALRIPSRIIQSQWKDRILDPSEIIPAVQRKSLKETPSPSKNSVVNTGGLRKARNKLLSKYGIVITQAPGNHNWAREKERYVAIIKDHGGTVLSDWLDVFSLQGKHSNANKRWTIQRGDVKYAPKDKQHSFDRVFLVSDIHHQKPKYLLALALGIPCVSFDWLDHIAAGEELPWSQFLLAAGHSEPLGVPISQLVDLDWGTTSEHMTEIMENSVPLKVLSGKSVLCLGSELFPNPSKKGINDADRHLEASRSVPRIIFAMGPSRVEAVADAKHASEDLARYDYVVVKDGSQHRRVRGATFVDVTWIKECLIAGRLVFIPDLD